MGEGLKELLETFARALVSRPGEVRVTQIEDEEGILLELEVAEEDKGRVIGRRGRTADALRTVLDAVAERQGTQCDVEVVD
ncbi:MAG TPA: KH domain-containing protein [Vicinamibacteria bacterium]|nr:KH domain-containing protein [Vicinamibacteria bacterium]